MLEKYLVQTCTLVTTYRDKWGNYVVTDGDTIPCRFRYIPTMKRVSAAEVSDADSMLWVGPNSGVEKGSIIKFEGAYYQVERINKARKLGSNTVEFIKCDLKVTDVNIS